MDRTAWILVSLLAIAVAGTVMWGVITLTNKDKAEEANSSFQVEALQNEGNDEKNNQTAEPAATSIPDIEQTQNTEPSTVPDFAEDNSNEEILDDGGDEALIDETPIDEVPIEEAPGDNYEIYFSNPSPEPPVVVIDSYDYVGFKIPYETYADPFEFTESGPAEALFFVYLARTEVDLQITDTLAILRQLYSNETVNDIKAFMDENKDRSLSDERSETFYDAERSQYIVVSRTMEEVLEVLIYRKFYEP